MRCSSSSTYAAVSGSDATASLTCSAYASLASSDPEEKDSVAAGLGLTVVAMLPVVQQATADTGRELYGLIAAGALIAVGLLAAAWGEGASWTLDDDAHPHEAGLLAVDAAQARARLGWRPRLPLARGLAWTADWYKRQLRGEAARRLVLDDIARYAAGALA